MLGSDTRITNNKMVKPSELILIIIIKSHSDINILKSLYQCIYITAEFILHSGSYGIAPLETQLPNIGG